MKRAFGAFVCLGALGLASALGSGCSSEDPAKKGQLMLVIKTDMDVPKDVRAVRLEILAGGVLRHSETYSLGPDPAEHVQLPGTFAIIAGDNPALPVKIRVIAYRGNKPQVIKETITTVPPDRIAALPLRIQWLCWEEDLPELPAPPGQIEPDTETTCSPGQTCSAGTCVASEIDSTGLPNYDAADVYGGASGPGAVGLCFDTLGCFDDSFLVPVDLNACTVGVPAGDPANVNVALSLSPGTQGICSGSTCLVPLDLDPEAGFTLDQQAGLIALPPAACTKILDGSVAGVAVSTSCATKTPSVPTCGPWSSVTSLPGKFDAGLELEGNDPCFVTLGNDGAHCGSALPQGDPATLYTCANGATAQTATCPAGCSETAGDDQCADADGGVDAAIDATSDAQSEPPPFKLGAACGGDAECGTGLKCVTPSSGALNGEGPAGGLCTIECTATPSICSGFGGPGACVAYGTQAWCLASCTPGAPASAKCSGRTDVACAPVTDLASGASASACRPVCANDAECPGLSCSLATGLCTGVPSQGSSPIGSNCMDAEAGAFECSSGACFGFTDPGPGFTTHVCSGLCVVGAAGACGGVQDGGTATGAGCIGPTDGDEGSCRELCNSTCGCSNGSFDCQFFNDPVKEAQFGALGYCTPVWELDGGFGC